MSDSIDKYLINYPLTEYMGFDPEKIHIDKSVRDMCARNSCGNYGKSYTCPPHTREIDEWIKEIGTFSHGIVFTKAYPREDSFDLEGLMKDGKDFNRTVTQMRKDLIEKTGDKNMLFLGAGACSVCSRCSCIDNEPCRFPDGSLTSAEACGIDVIRLCRDTGVKYNNGAKSTTFIGLMLYGP